MEAFLPNLDGYSFSYYAKQNSVVIIDNSLTVYNWFASLESCYTSTFASASTVDANTFLTVSCNIKL